MQIGYKLSCEEHSPVDLVRFAQRAESIGMSFGMISDHFHPWTDQQGHSPFVWSVLGGIAATTNRFNAITGVTCPTVRIHPAILAQASATTAAMMPGRFVFGVGTGENLNEHVLGDPWPNVDRRLEMLEEAVDVIRRLWGGKQVNYEGKHYRVENAKLYTRPPEPPPIMVAAGGKKAAAVAGRIGDGLVGVSPDPDVVSTFEERGGGGKPKYCEVQACWAPSEEEAKKVAVQWWPNSALPGQLTQELAVPAHFEQAAQLVSADDVCSSMSCGPDPEVHAAGITKFAEAGYDHIAVHQVGPGQEGFFDFYEQAVLPRL
jgi:G6PDH family F420-dependent oxidoreductase